MNNKFHGVFVFLVLVLMFGSLWLLFSSNTKARTHFCERNGLRIDTNLDYCVSNHSNTTKQEYYQILNVNGEYVLGTMNTQTKS